MIQFWECMNGVDFGSGVILTRVLIFARLVIYPLGPYRNILKFKHVVDD